MLTSCYRAKFTNIAFALICIMIVSIAIANAIPFTIPFTITTVTIILTTSNSTATIHITAIANHRLQLFTSTLSCIHLESSMVSLVR